MPVIDLYLKGDGCWPDLARRREDGDLVELMGKAANPIGLALLRGGMVSGKASVAIRIDLPDGRVVLTETSLELMETAVRAMCVRAGTTPRKSHKTEDET